MKNMLNHVSFGYKTTCNFAVTDLEILCCGGNTLIIEIFYTVFQFMKTIYDYTCILH